MAHYIKGTRRSDAHLTQKTRRTPTLSKAWRIWLYKPLAVMRVLERKPLTAIGT